MDWYPARTLSSIKQKTHFTFSASNLHRLTIALILLTESNIDL